MSNAFISPEVAALLDGDRKVFDKAKKKENPFDIKAPDGTYCALLAKVQIKVKQKDGKKFLGWTFMYMLLANSENGNKQYAGNNVIVRHDLNDTAKRTKEEAWEYLVYDLKALGVANVDELTTADFEDLMRGLNTKRKAVLISIVTKDGYKNPRLREVVKFESVKSFITAEIQAQLEQASESEIDEEGEEIGDGGNADAFASMDRAQMIETNKKYELGIKSKGMSDDDFRNALRAAVAEKLAAERAKAEAAAGGKGGKDKPPFDTDEEEEEEEEEEEVDPVANMDRPAMIALNKEKGWGIKSKNQTDDWFRDEVRARLKAEKQPTEDPNSESEEE